ncbi:MAG: hypothetical protein JO000_03600, partial [Alphaproteobacteria bacterium]|nr:hypothetical protein [Alphaproteobacteria bacterium]
MSMADSPIARDNFPSRGTMRRRSGVFQTAREAEGLGSKKARPCAGYALCDQWLSRAIAFDRPLGRQQFTPMVDLRRFFQRHADVLVLCVLTVLICFLRRPDQFLHPYVWAEDGAFVLKGYADAGLSSVLEPVNGYFNLSARLLSLAAFKLSLWWAPEISVVLAVAFTCAVVVAIARAPTLLPHPFLCALAPLVVPTGPEMFDVALYSFWWAGLLLLLVLVWDPTRGGGGLRAFFAGFGGLSSPLIVPMTPLLWLRAIVERRPSEILPAAVATVAALAQVLALVSGEPATAPHPNFDPVLAADVFAGLFAATPRNWLSEYHQGVIVLAFIAGTALLARKRLRWEIVLLALAWCAAVLIVQARIGDLRVLAASGAGPRYFFYPLVILMWIAIWIASVSPRVVGAVMVGGLVLALYAGREYLVYFHDPIDWRREIASCARTDGDYQLPIHWVGGHRDDVHLVRLTGAQCRAMLEAS